MCVCGLSEDLLLPWSLFCFAILAADYFHALWTDISFCSVLWPSTLSNTSLCDVCMILALSPWQNWVTLNWIPDAPGGGDEWGRWGMMTDQLSCVQRHVVLQRMRPLGKCAWSSGQSCHWWHHWSVCCAGWSVERPSSSHESSPWPQELVKRCKG